MRLIADRFAQEETAADGYAIDLATGRVVTLVSGSAGGVSDQARWSFRCDALQRLHHRSIATLVDFGIVGESSRFEAWGCGQPWIGSSDRALTVAECAG